MPWPPNRLLLRLLAGLGVPAAAEDLGPEQDPIEQRLGRLHQRRLGSHRRRGQSAYYTPAALADYVARQTLGSWLAGRSLAEVASLRVLDPACGAGAFLAAAYRLLLRFYLDRLAADPARRAEATVSLRGGGRTLRGTMRREILLRHLRGVDLDPGAARLCRLALALIALDAPPRPTRLDVGALGEAELACRIRCADALRLAGPDASPFDWRAAFPDTPDEQPAFDVVLGNPPHRGGVRRASQPPPPLPAEVRRLYTSARGTIDDSILFQELALRLLSPGGRAGLVVPNKFLAAPFGAAFRRLALEQAELRLLADLSAARPFCGVAAYPIAYVLEARPPRRHYPVEIHRFAPGPAGMLRLLERRQVRLEVPPGAPWTPLLSEKGALLRRVQEAGPALGSLYEVCAAATAAEAYALRACLCDGAPEGPAFLFVTSGAVDRYRHRHGRGDIRYLGRRYRAPYLPHNAPALSATRRRQYGSEKLIVASMTRRLEVLWDPGEVAPAVPMVQVLARPGAPPLHYLLALLNSRLLSWLVQEQFSALSLSGGYLRIGAAQIRSLPVPWVDRELMARAAEGAARMLTLAASGMEQSEELQAADRELDQLVCRIFGLGEKEVAWLASSPVRARSRR